MTKSPYLLKFGALVAPVHDSATVVPAVRAATLSMLIDLGQFVRRPSGHYMNIIDPSLIFHTEFLKRSMIRVVIETCQGGK